MLNTVKDLILRPTCHTITFEYHSYGDIIVVCTVKRIYHKHLAVQAVSTTDDGALNRALDLLDEVIVLEAKIGHPIAPENMRNDDGYHRERLVDDWHIEYKRSGATFAITRVYRQDEYKFTICKEPRNIAAEDHGRVFQLTSQEQMVTTGFRDNLDNVKDQWLGEGEELWAWNDIRCLSGSAGYLIVKDGKIVREKCVLIS